MSPRYEVFHSESMYGGVIALIGPVVIWLLLTFLISLIFFRRFLGGSMPRGFLLWLMTVGGTVLLIAPPVAGAHRFGRGWHLFQTHPPEVVYSYLPWNGALLYLLVFLLVMLSVGFGLKLWQKWVCGMLTEREKQAARF